MQFKSTSYLDLFSNYFFCSKIPFKCHTWGCHNPLTTKFQSVVVCMIDLNWELSDVDFMFTWDRT